MAYTYDFTFKHQKYKPKFEWLDDVKRTPEENQEIIKEWYKNNPPFPYRHNPLFNGTTARMTSRHKAVCDIFPFSGGGGCCSQAFKDLIDELEPETHEFFPLALQWKNGDPIEDKYYLFSPLLFIDSIIPEKSSIKLVEGRENGPVYFKWERSEPPIREYYTLDSGIIRGKHVWTEQKLPIGMRCCSDEFHDEFLERDLKFLEFTKINEV